MSALMSAKAEWVEQFRVSQENLEKWRKEAGPQTDLLRWCLLNGKITESDYLQWACEHYELPTVEAQFFSLPADTEFWETVAAQGPWSESLFPLHEWQGVWLIACIAPDASAKFAKPHRFVLSSARALDMLWKTLNHGFENRSRTGFDKTATATFAIPVRPNPVADESRNAPDGLAAALAALNSAAPGNENAADRIVIPELFKDAPEPPAPDANEVTSGPATEAPDGLAGLASLGGGPKPETPYPGAPMNSDALSALNFELPSPLNDEKTPVGENTKSDAVEKTPLAPPMIDVQVMKAPPPAPPPKVDSAFAKEMTGLTAKSKLPFIPPVAKPDEPASAPIGSSRETVDMSQIDISKTPGRASSGATEFRQCTSLDEVTELSFAKMQGLFQKAIMLVFQGGQLRPWKWTGTVAYPGKGKPNPIDLTQASIFKIVYTTALPYHGHIVPNPINNQFFGEFNGGVTPSHVTVMPVMVSGQIAGMLMGMTDARLNLRAALRQMEALNEEVSAALTRIRTNKAA